MSARTANSRVRQWLVEHFRLLLFGLCFERRWAASAINFQLRQTAKRHRKLQQLSWDLLRMRTG
jgi:hypothetical protein